MPQVQPSAEVLRIWSAPRLTPGLAQQRGEAGAEPPGVAHVRAADLVGHAGQGDVGLGERPLQQLIEGDVQLPLDHAVHPEVPRLRRDLGQAERGVHPVEAPVGRGERADPGDGEVRAARRRWPADLRAGEPDRGARRGHVEPGQQRLAGPGPGDREGGGPGRGEEEPAAVWGTRDVTAGGLSAPGGRGSRGADQQEQDDRASGHAHEGGHRVGRTRHGPGRDGRDADSGENGQPGQPVGQSAPAQDPDKHGEKREHDIDSGEQHGLVVAAEMLDGEVLDRNGGQVDSRASDRDHRFPRGPGDAGHQLGHADRHRDGQEPGQGAGRSGPEEAPRALRYVLHHHRGNSGQTRFQIGGPA